MKALSALSLLLFVTFSNQSVFAAKNVTIESRKTITSSKMNLKGLSAFAAYSLADTFDFEASSAGQTVSGTFSAENAVGLGAVYNATTLPNGIGIDVGGSYEFSRSISKSKVNGATQSLTTKPEVQMWTVFGNATAYLNPQLGVFAGGNYLFPVVNKIPDSSWKGGIGFQVGATYQFTNEFAIDGQYKTQNMTGTAKNDAGGETSFDKMRLQGFSLAGRYLF